MLIGIACMLLMQAKGQQVQYHDFGDVEKLLSSDADTTYVINLWATWCKPCVEELPYFSAVDSMMQGTAVRIILLSLDAQLRWESSLLPFLQAHPMQTEVWALYPERPSDWIDRIAPQWSGAIPGTLFLHGRSGKRLFVESDMTVESILEKIQTAKTQN